MKNTITLIAVFLLIGTINIFGQQPVEYSSAVPLNPGNSSYYLTKDSYEQVVSFYERIYGRPDHVSTQEGPDRNATFFYKEITFEPLGIHISEMQGNSRAVVRVFSELKGLIVRNALDQSQYNEIENIYMHLKDHYYANDSDEAIFDKYYKVLGEGGIGAVDKEETMKKAQELMMSGKMTEGLELLEKMKESMIDGVSFSGSPEAINSWVECLEEMDEKKYPVLIKIDR